MTDDFFFILFCIRVYIYYTFLVTRSLLLNNYYFSENEKKNPMYMHTNTHTHHTTWDTSAHYDCA